MFFCPRVIPHIKTTSTMVNDSQHTKLLRQYKFLHSMIERMVQHEDEILIGDRTICLIIMKIMKVDFVSVAYRNRWITLFPLLSFDAKVFDNLDDLWYVWSNIPTYVVKLHQIIRRKKHVFSNIFPSLLALNSFTFTLTSNHWLF